MKSINCSHTTAPITAPTMAHATAHATALATTLAMLMDKQISICIPRVDNRFTKEFIQSIFNNCQLGKIDSIDIVPNHKENAKFNRIFVHYSSMSSEFHLKRLLGGGSLKVVYEGPWFWKCVQSKVPRKK
jgi:hypothetical protein